MTIVVWSEAMSRAYAAYMERNVEHDHRRFAARIAADWPALKRGARVVDLAGGPGFLVTELAPLLNAPRLTVVDDSPVMIDVARERARARGLALEVVQAAAHRLPFADAEVDLILCKHFLRFAPDLGAVLRETRRVLAPGGRAYLIDFNGEGPYVFKRLLWLWIRATAPEFLARDFWASMQQGLRATAVQRALVDAGFGSAEILRSSVSYLIRATR